MSNFRLDVSPRDMKAVKNYSGTLLFITHRYSSSPGLLVEIAARPF